jgi:hypothetical protein
VSRQDRRLTTTGLAILAQSGPLEPPGYTRSVAWRHRIALLLLLTLTGMPVGGTVCALMCESSQTTSHHGTDGSCEEPARSSGQQIGGASGHDCSTHDASMRLVATTAAERTDLSAKAAPAVVGRTEDEVVTLHVAESLFDYAAPPGTAPRTTRPAVLRV